MQIASQLKKSNICEYLLYMWQLEDLLRAYRLDMRWIEKDFIAKFKVKNDVEKKTLYEWYESLVDMMRMDNLQLEGHHQLNKNTIIELNEFHQLLLKSGKAPAYNAKFFHILPLVNQFRKKSKLGLSDLELCFNFQYGIILLRMGKKEISADTLQIQTEISKFMVLLSQNYLAYKSGDLDLE